MNSLVSGMWETKAYDYVTSLNKRAPTFVCITK